MWDAFEDGDRWVRMTKTETARYTGVSLVFNGVAEDDPDTLGPNGGYSMRVRLSEGTLNANGYTRNDEGWRAYAADITALEAEDNAATLAVAGR